MKQSTFIRLAFVVLILLNVSLLAFIFFGPHPPHDRQGPEKFDHLVIRTLGLNDSQVKKFDRLKKEHRDEMIANDEQMKTLFNEYFSNLNTKNRQSKDSVERMITELYRRKVAATYDHFEQLKNSCTSAQKEKFIRLVPELMQVISSEKKAGHPPERNGDRQGITARP